MAQTLRDLPVTAVAGAMSNLGFQGHPIHRGRTLLSSPIVFVPKPAASFPWTICLYSNALAFLHGAEVIPACIFVSRLTGT